MVILFQFLCVPFNSELCHALYHPLYSISHIERDCTTSFILLYFISFIFKSLLYWRCSGGALPMRVRIIQQLVVPGTTSTWFSCLLDRFQPGVQRQPGKANKRVSQTGPDFPNTPPRLWPNEPSVDRCRDRRYGVIRPMVGKGHGAL